MRVLGGAAKNHHVQVVRAQALQGGLSGRPGVRRPHVAAVALRAEDGAPLGRDLDPVAREVLYDPACSKATHAEQGRPALPRILALIPHRHAL